MDLEGGADQVVDEVEFGAFEEIERHRVDQHDGPVTFDHKVVVHAGVVEGEIVLETRATAAGHRQAQHHGLRLSLEDLGDPFGCAR